MSTTTSTVTLEPAKRILRTVVAVVVAGAATVGTVLAFGIHVDNANITAILGEASAVATAITAFAASSAGNYVFGLIGLGATTVTKLGTDATATVAAATPAVAAAVTAVEAPTVASAIAAADAAVAAVAPVEAAATAVASDVTDVAK